MAARPVIGATFDNRAADAAITQFLKLTGGIDDTLPIPLAFAQPDQGLMRQTITLAGIGGGAVTDDFFTVVAANSPDSTARIHIRPFQTDHGYTHFRIDRNCGRGWPDDLRRGEKSDN